MYVFCPRYIDSRAVHTGRSTSQVTQQNNADTNLAVSLAARSVGRRLFFCTAFDVCTLSCAVLVIPCRSALREGRCLVAFAWISKFATASIFFFVMGLALRSAAWVLSGKGTFLWWWQAATARSVWVIGYSSTVTLCLVWSSANRKCTSPFSK